MYIYVNLRVDMYIMYIYVNLRIDKLLEAEIISPNIFCSILAYL